MASSAFEADVYQHIEAIKAANVYAAMSGSIEAVQPANSRRNSLFSRWRHLRGLKHPSLTHPQLTSKMTMALFGL